MTSKLQVNLGYAQGSENFESISKECNYLVHLLQGHNLHLNMNDTFGTPTTDWFTRKSLKLRLKKQPPVFESTFFVLQNSKNCETPWRLDTAQNVYRHIFIFLTVNITADQA